MKRRGNIVELTIGLIISFAIIMWFFEFDIQDVKDKINSAEAKIELQESEIIENAKLINEKAVRVLNENVLLKGQVLECETRRVEIQQAPDPYGTGY